MKNVLKKLVVGFLDRWLRPVASQLKRQDTMLRTLADANARTRSILNRLQNQPIHVVFVCHNPSLWGKLNPVYIALRSDTCFKVSIVSAPYRHSIYGDDDFRDGGMAEFLKNNQIDAIEGYNKTNKQWLDLQDISPDYVFFQTPYDWQFPLLYTSEYISLFSRICYVPYFGILLYKGEVEKITHPPSFFRNVNIAFVSNASEREDLLSKFPDILSSKQVVVAGSPMLDYALGAVTAKGYAWKRNNKSNVKRILWTPRWRTSEGNCHFFDYKDYLLELANMRDDIDILFRPHPLCLPNFLATGEFPKEKQDEMFERVARMPNAGIDQSGDYQDTFLSSDILVSDMSSMLGEYFVTGKPIVYTHRVDSFNEFGAKLAKGFYWVRNQTELDEILQQLMRGEDPLKLTRQELIKKMFFVPRGGASNFIRNCLKAKL
jgi:CDP-Glycerol:Poly(glycerophosphate) glycerophosphotransferase